MRLYEITRFEDDAHVSWTRTLDEAHRLAKQLTVPQARHEARIVLKDYTVDHKGVVLLFNGVHPQGTPIRQWRLNARGALRELVFGERPPIIEE